MGSADGHRSRRRLVRRVPPPLGPRPNITAQRTAKPRDLVDIWTPSYDDFGPPQAMYPEKGSGYEPSGYGNSSAGPGRYLGGIAEERARQRQGLRFFRTLWVVMVAFALLAFLAAVLSLL